MLQQVLNFYLSIIMGFFMYFNQSQRPPFTLPFRRSRVGFVVYVGGGGCCCRGSSASGGHLCVDGVGEADVERVVVLHQGCLVVVEHQVLQAAVQVVGLSEAKAARRAVDDAVLHLAFHTKERHAQETGVSELQSIFTHLF